MSPAHILTFHLNSYWGGHFPVLWSLPRAYSEPDNPNSNMIKEMTRKILINDIKEKKPKIIVIEFGDKLPRYPKGFSFLNVFKGNEDFNDEFSKYNLIKKVPYNQEMFFVYKRKVL